MAWQSRYAGRAGLDDRPVAVAASGGRVLVAGSVGIDQTSPCRRCPDMAVLEHDPGTGVVDEVMRYDGPMAHMDVTRALAVGRHGVYVTGMSVGSFREWAGIGEPPRDYVTLRYPPAREAR